MVSGLFKSIPGVTVLKNLVRIISNHWLTAMIDRKIVGKTNEDLRLALEAVNIESRPLWKLCICNRFLQAIRIMVPT
jgi:hypothetical protein